MKNDQTPDQLTIEKMTDILNKFAKDRDWSVYHTPLQLALSLNLESSEVLELFQWKSEEKIHSLVKDKDFRRRLAEEMADVLSYLLLLSNVTGIELKDAWLKKIEQNSEKYPIGLAKGNAKKYTEL